MASSHFLSILQRRVTYRPARSAAAVATAVRAGCGGEYGRRARLFSVVAARRNEHSDETFEEFTARYEKEFDGVKDVFDLQRNLNNAFAYDLVPSASVCEAAIRAARRVNDFPTAVRIFEGLKAKTENQAQYQEYLDELKPLREELGILLKDEMFEK